MYVCTHVCICMYVYTCVFNLTVPSIHSASVVLQRVSNRTHVQWTGEAGRSNTLVNEQSGGFWLVVTVHSVKRSYHFRAARELGGSHTADGRLATSKSTLRTRACTHTHSS